MMNNIGQRIKDLRKKNDLTQEKLADFLGVTYQSVSKWECGVTMPDLSLIVPLAKLLHVSTDELLGVNEIDKRLEELEELYENALKENYTTDEPLRIAKQAVCEYPSDMKWLNRYAWDTWCYAIDNLPDGEEFDAEREKVIKLFDRVIGNTDDDQEKASAIDGIVGCLCGKGWKNEAKHYVELYPDTKVDPWQKRKLLGACLDGDEQKQYKQESLNKIVRELVDTLIWGDNWNNEDAHTAAHMIITAVIPDGNYLEYHQDISRILLKKAESAIKSGEFSSAIDLIKEALFHAKEYDIIDTVCPGEYQYTAPLFDHLKIDSRQWYHGGTIFEEHKAALCQRKVFAPIRDLEDFKTLFD
ncbi:MAG: helix-turn-helix transcriptional regulator [Clostridia bacterium]|nr:helix-turn-helix transcriptional regulator [Clostridia bacterium]